MGKRNKVTTRDIAEHLGLSQSTVSMILSNRKNVSFSEETIEKVKATAKELGYTRTIRRPAKGQSPLAQSLIVLSPSLSNVYYCMITQAITERAKEYGYTVFNVTTLRDVEQETLYLNILSEFELAGIISLYPPAKMKEANLLSKKIPIVSIGDKPEMCQFDSIELDSKKPGYMIGEHLISLGHTHITYITTPLQAKEIGRVHRLEGLQTSFKDHGISTDQIEIRTSSATAYRKYPLQNSDYLNGYTQASKALEEQTKSTAFVGNNDMTAFGIMAALSDHGCRVPYDYSVCGFDNIPLAAMPQISLTTIEHASTYKGQEAVDIIYRKNTQKKNDSGYHYIMRMEYQPELIIRKSTGKCRNA